MALIAQAIPFLAGAAIAAFYVSHTKLLEYQERSKRRFADQYEKHLHQPTDPFLLEKLSVSATSLGNPHIERRGHSYPFMGEDVNDIRKRAVLTEQRSQALGEQHYGTTTWQAKLRGKPHPNIPRRLPKILGKGNYLGTGPYTYNEY